MEEEVRILDHLAEAFAFLVEDFGFTEPLVRPGRWSTCVDCPKGDLVIEFEVDWREFDVFASVVLADGGTVPEGYSASHGPHCRRYIWDIYSEQGWPMVPIKVVPLLQRTEADVFQVIDDYRALFADRISDILELGEELFG